MVKLLTSLLFLVIGCSKRVPELTPSAELNSDQPFFSCQKTGESRFCYTEFKHDDAIHFKRKEAFCFTRSVLNTFSNFKNNYSSWSDEVLQVCLPTYEECFEIHEKTGTGLAGEPLVKTNCIKIRADEHSDKIILLH
jgi:hypothetical protein